MPKYDKLRKEHWAWQPLTRAEAARRAAMRPGRATTSIASSWPGWKRRGCSPVGDADRLTLLRRVTFDLTGLPPTPAEIDAFVEDASTDAFEKVVDRLLASPRFGERWGRHWLDVARYGESTGTVAQRSLSARLALSRLRHRRLQHRQAVRPVRPRADRRRPAARRVARRSAIELLIATGFLALGVKDVNQRFKVRFIMDNVDEQIDTVSRSVLALTVELRPLPRPQVRPDPDRPTTTPWPASSTAPTSAPACGTRWAAAAWTTTTPTMLLHARARTGRRTPRRPRRSRRRRRPWRGQGRVRGDPRHAGRQGPGAGRQAEADDRPAEDEQAARPSCSP